MSIPVPDLIVPSTIHWSCADPQKLTVLRSHMEEMQVRCDQVQAELDQANKGTRHLLERADGLRVQRCVSHPLLLNPYWPVRPC